MLLTTQSHVAPLGILREEELPLSSPPPVHQAQDLPEEPPTADHVTRLSSGGGGRDTSPLSGTLAAAQCSGEGWAKGAGKHSIHTLLFFLLRFF